MDSMPTKPNVIALRRRTGPFVAAIGSAIALWLAFPPVDRGFLGWFALAPFFSLARSDDRWWKVYLASWCGGLTFGLLSMSWVAYADLAGMFWMALFMSLWWPMALLPARVAVRRLRLPLIVAGPVAWVGMEYLRAHILSGFPWYYLAHTQYAYLVMIQVCDLAGAWGLSLLMAAANVLWLDLFTLPLMRPSESGPRIVRGQKVKAIGVNLAIVATVVYGAARLSTVKHRPGPRVALLQSDFPQALRNGRSMAEMLASMESLVLEALDASPHPDLIVWPETTYPVGFVSIAPNLSESEFNRLAKLWDDRSDAADWRDRQARSSKELHGFADDSGVPMVVGAIAYDFRPGGLDRSNSAGLFVPGRSEVLEYRKQSLVPIGEYIPFVEAMPWLLALTPYTDGYIPSLVPGKGPVIMESRGVRYAPIICFEDTIPHIARVAARQSPRPDVFLNLTNDGWFRGSSEQQIHLAISVFRAVECRTPLVRSVNTGISAVIDGDGRILATIPAEKKGVLTAGVPLDGRFSLYLVVGDVLGVASLATTLGWMLLATIYPRQLPLLAQAPSVG